MVLLDLTCVVENPLLASILIAGILAVARIPTDTHTSKTGWRARRSSAIARSRLGIELLALSNKKNGVIHWDDADSSQNEDDVVPAVLHG